jgi:hypothetical protein
MPYIFPEKRLRNGSIATPETLNRATQPAAELFSGRLDRHNLESGLALEHSSDNDNQGNTCINHYWTAQSADPQTDDSGTWQLPTNPPSHANEWPFPEHLTWVTVANMTQTITTGNSTLWIMGFLQYIWHNYDLGNIGRLSTVFDSSKSYSVAANIQIVVTLNGSILADTLSGHENPSAKAVRPYRWRTTQDFDNETAASRGLPGMLTGYSLDIAGIGPEMLPTRMMTFAQVQAGTHTIEVKVRRLLPSYGGRDLRADTFAYNRWLYVGEIQNYPPAVTDNSTVSTAHFEPGDTITAAKLNAGGAGGLAAAYNDIDRGSLARGALTRSHVTSALIGAGTATFSSDITSDNGYPGWNSSTVTTSTSTNAVGWLEIESSDVGITIDEPCYLIILADAHMREVYDNGGTPYDAMLLHMLIGVRATESGSSPAVTMYKGSMGTVAAYNLWGDDPAEVSAFVVPEHARVALGWVIDYTTIPDPALTINQIKLYAAAQSMDPSGSPDPTYTLTAGSLSWMLIKA